MRSSRRRARGRRNDRAGDQAHRRAQEFRRDADHSRRQSHRAGGRAARDHRPERRRKIHAVQPDQRPAYPYLRRDRAQRRERDRAGALSDQPARPSRSFQVTNIFPRLSVWENVRCAVLWSLGYRYAFWRGIEGLADVRERTEHILAEIDLIDRRACRPACSPMPSSVRSKSASPSPAAPASFCSTSRARG